MTPLRPVTPAEPPGADEPAAPHPAAPHPAAAIAAELLAGSLPRRWAHVRAVAARAAAVAAVVPAGDRAILVAAAWLHDIGYAPPLVRTGFHPLDGARWLRDHGHDPRLAALVAHHSYARHEAERRGVDLGEFPREESLTADALAFADLTTGPDGRLMDVEARIAEIHERYGPGHVVSRTWRHVAPEAVAMSRRVEAVWRATTK